MTPLTKLSYDWGQLPAVVRTHDRPLLSSHFLDAQEVELRTAVWSVRTVARTEPTATRLTGTPADGGVGPTKRAPPVNAKDRGSTALAFFRLPADKCLTLILWCC
jgi:hypothetical protein